MKEVAKLSELKPVKSQIIENLTAAPDHDQQSINVLCSSNEIFNHILSEIHDLKSTIGNKLSSMELQISLLSQTCNKISSRLDDIEKNQNILVGSQQNMSSPLSPDSESLDDQKQRKLTLVPMTKESDYPCGSWLGDPKVPTRRVRCALTPTKLFHINTTCLTAMKLALTLLDHLFTQEDLALSNISGRSNKGKKQLNPVLVFGIKCHLEYKFLINDKDWSKICQSIDAKCRFMWKKRNISMMNNKRNDKRKLSPGSPLPVVKARDTGAIITTTREAVNFDFDHLTNSSIDFNSCVKVITESPCELRIVNASPAQIAQLQESQGIILAQEIIPDANDEKSILIDSSPDLSMNTVVMNAQSEHMETHLTIPTEDEQMETHLTIPAHSDEPVDDNS